MALELHWPAWDAFAFGYCHFLFAKGKEALFERRLVLSTGQQLLLTKHYFRCIQWR